MDDHTLSNNDDLNNANQTQLPEGGRDGNAASHSAGQTTAPDGALIRHDWQTDEIVALLEAPLMELLYRAQTVHRQFHEDGTVQLASLLSIKTGSCPEDCKYCPQSAHYGKKTGLEKESLMATEAVMDKARQAKEAGATRFCMGAAWRNVRDGAEFDRVVEMVQGVSDMGMEACVTLGMLTEEQADRLKAAGLNSYNHNIDTSPEFYEKIITTRTFEDRLETISHVQKAGISLCSGGIIGMGETVRDRARMLEVLANLTPHPGSVPINALVAVPGTPMQDRKPIDPLELVRMVATARILMPKARVRLSAGRKNLNDEAQLLCFMGGANSIFYGEKLLTTGNNDGGEDVSLITRAGLKVEG